MSTQHRSSHLFAYLVDSCHQILSTTNLDALLRDVIDNVLQFVGAERGHIILLADNNSFNFRVSRHRDGRDIKQPPREISFTILREVLTSGQSMRLSNVLTNSRFLHAESAQKLKLCSVLCIPLKTPSQIIGALYLENRAVSGVFSEGDKNALILFANQAAIAIENAYLNEALQQTNKHLQTVDRHRTQLFQLMSHELRSPITVFLLYLDLLKIQTTAKSQEQLNLAAKRIKDLVDNFLLALKIVTGSLELEIGRTTIETIVQQAVIKFASPSMEERNITLHVNGLDTLPFDLS